ncbi:hypothetical protein Leryth_009139 [Lithospermum erythrorhizon]|nr:hypothetical protein Leryth_009139 [Lithospermum erythrorhizon]
MFYLVAILIICGVAKGAVYKVGDSNGWNGHVDYKAWAASKQFHVGDTILFEYKKEFQNVVKVSHKNYRTCNATTPYGTWTSGNDSFTIPRTGHYFFISSFPNQCQTGQKVDIRVHATPAPKASPPWSPVPSPRAPAPHNSVAPKASPRLSPTPHSGVVPKASPQRSPTPSPWAPTPHNGVAPKASPTQSPTPHHSVAPTQSPTPHHGVAPKAAPTQSPTPDHGVAPTQSPTPHHGVSPTQAPTPHSGLAPKAAPVPSPTPHHGVAPKAAPVPSPTPLAAAPGSSNVPSDQPVAPAQAPASTATSSMTKKYSFLVAATIVLFYF